MHADEAAIVSHLRAHPDDTTARLVFADWLDERGDPRGPWLRDPDLWEWMQPDACDPLPRLRSALLDADQKVRSRAASANSPTTSALTR